MPFALCNFALLLLLYCSFANYCFTMRTQLLLPLVFVCLSIPCQLKSQWTQVVSGTASNLNTVEVINADTVYAAGSSVFLRSVNGGQTWSPIAIVNTANQPINGLTINDLHFFNSQTGIAVGVRSSTIHTVLRTTDGGLHWSVVVTQNDLQGWSGGITRVDFINIMQGWCVGSSGKVRRTLDGGLSWSDLPDVQNVAYLKTVDFTNSQVGYLTTAFSFGGGEVMKTTNGGQTWAALSGGIFHELHFVHPDTGFLADQNYAFRMHDGNINWDFLPIPDEATARRFAFQNGSTGFMLADNGVRRTQNGGQFWEENRFPGSNTVEMRDFDWAAGFQTGVAVGVNGRIYKTANGGGTATPMAYFQTDPIFVTFCKDQTIQLINPAPAGQWNTSWFVDGAFYSSANDVSVSFSEYGSTHEVLLLISNGFASDTFQRTIQIEQDLEFQFGTVEWVTGPQICAGGNAIVRVVHPAVNMSYAFLVNDEVIGQQLAYDTSAIIFQTPYLNEDATLKISSSITSFCGSVFKEEVLQVETIPFPNPNLNWSITDNVCVNSQAQVMIQNSQPGMRYWLVESGIFTVSDTLAGTGGTLTFFSKPLTQPVDYQIRATNSIGCMNWINAPIHVNIDFFYLMVDTTHLYGVVDQPIRVNNFTENLGSSNWTFGAGAQPATSQSASPDVTYHNAGDYPFIYQYQSQFSCLGTLQGHFEVFEQAADLNGASCWSQPLLNAVYVYQNILDVKVDPSGDYWVTGATFEQVGFWYTMNLFLNKYDPSGVLLWSKQVDPLDPANSFDYRSTYGTSIAFDPDGNAYLTGSYSADKARIFGVDFTRPTSFFASYGQGFLFKLSPDGDVIWHSNFQSPSDYDFSIPSSIVFHNNRLHLMLKGRDWQMIQPDGNSAINGHPNAAAWYIAVDTDGNFVQDLPILEEIPNSLYGNWHPDLGGSILTDLTTFKSPRLLVSPNGNLLVNGVYTGLSNITVGGISIEPLDSTFSARNQFIAAINPASGVCEQAFCAYGIQTPQNDFPAWEVDADGDVFLGFGLNGSIPVYTPAVTIGTTHFNTSPNRSFIAKFSENGDLLSLQRHTDQVFNSFVQANGGGIWALSRFDRAVGFHNPDGSAAGAISNGGNDLLLSRLDDDGALLGLQHFGGPEHEQPVAMVAAGPSLLGIFSADDLNINLNGPVNPYTLRVWSTDQTDCPALSVPTITGLQEWSISPNPFSDAITCTIELQEPQKDVICRLRSLDGRLMWSQSTGQLPSGVSVLQFETQQTAAGIYFFEITTQQGTSVRKIIKWKL